MNIFICNKYDSKKEDIHIITPNIPIDKNMILYLNYEHIKNLKKLKYNLANTKNEKNLSQGKEDSDELQIIEYPYQPQQTNYDLNEHYSNKSRGTNSNNETNIEYFNCFNNHKNKDCFYERKIINDFHKMKHSFSCLSESLLNNSINNKLIIKNYNDNSDLDIEDTIKGEDNINISKLKIKKNLKIQRKIDNLKKISNINKNKNKSNFKNKLIKIGGLNINKSTYEKEKENNITKNMIITQSNRKLNKNVSSGSSQKSNKYTVKHIFSNKNNSLNKNNKINKNYESKSKIGLIPSNCYYKSRNNKSKNNQKRNHIHKNCIGNDFLINDNNQNIEYNKKSMNNNKNIIEGIKRKIKNDLFN